MGTFQAMVLNNGLRREVECERIGQLAIHATVYFSDYFGEVRTDDTLTLSHAASGYRVWTFEDWVLRQDIQRLAHLLSGLDFDSYYAAGCVDAGFVGECKRWFAEWETTVPGRLEHDRISDDQRVQVAT